MAYKHEIRNFEDIFNLQLADFKRTKMKIMGINYRINICDYLLVYIDFLPTDVNFCYYINRKKLSLLEEKDPYTFVVNKGNENYFLQFYLPTSGKISLDEDNIIISGYNSEYDHKAFFCVISKEKFEQIDPLLAKNRNYPDNFICGFNLQSDKSKYIIFKHSGNTHLNYSGTAKHEDKLFSVLRFKRDILEDIWSFDKKLKLKHY